jgi:methanethiol S-methyltransferase
MHVEGERAKASYRDSISISQARASIHAISRKLYGRAPMRRIADISASSSNNLKKMDIEGEKLEYLLIALLWTGYCLLHSFLISIRFTDLMTRLLKNYYAFYRIFFVFISVVLIIPLINHTNQLDNNMIITYGPLLNVIRYILISGSLLMFSWAFFFNYDSLSFFGIRQILNFGKINKANPSEEIKRNGLLGVIRHPMYLSLIIYLWCQIFTVSDIIVNIVLTIYIIIATRLEEKKLVLEVGDAYVKYQQEVPMFITFIEKKVR